jgi:hypothetical protein
MFWMGNGVEAGGRLTRQAAVSFCGTECIYMRQMAKAVGGNLPVLL